MFTDFVGVRICTCSALLQVEVNGCPLWVMGLVPLDRGDIAGNILFLFFSWDGLALGKAWEKDLP